MRSKAALSMLEQVLMLLIFAVAAVLCLRAFVWAELKSTECVEQDSAMIQLQSAAEVIKYYRGDFGQAAEVLGGSGDDDTLTVFFDKSWSASESGTYRLSVRRLESGNEYLGMADLQLYEGETSIAQLQLCWQEVGKRG